ncbi:hypothetical protein MTO96_048855 [Rhipicephalus appendiculatus]
MLLERVGLLYTWLMSRQKIGPWLLVRFGASALQGDLSTLLVNVSGTMESLGQPAYLGVSEEHGTTYYGCLITDCWDETERNWAAVFVVLWSGQRFAAAYAGTNEQQRTLMNCLHVALGGESVEVIRGLHADLDEVFLAGLRDSGGSTLLRLNRNPSIGARFFPNGDPREQAEDQV